MKAHAKIPRVQRLVIYLVIICILISPMIDGRVVSAPSNRCPAGRSMNIVAHEDDDILFMNPDIQKDISAGKCVTTVYVTIGDYGQNKGVKSAEQREFGSKAAYAVMANVKDEWQDKSVYVYGHQLQQSVLKGNPKIKLIFMRLPNTTSFGRPFKYYGYQSLDKLYFGQISNIKAADDSAVYTLDQLVSTIGQIIDLQQPGTIRTQDFDEGLNPSDHIDHIMVALLVKNANQQIEYRHTLIGYQQYRISLLKPNLSLAEQKQKEKIWFAYAYYDHWVCHSIKACKTANKKNEDENYYRWLSREYISKEIKTVPKKMPAQPRTERPVLSLQYQLM